ncbi:M48 family metalloprotease [Magnetovibrio sp.]|uniref:M48 family metalloprotease n=1 Tax=Magnetovibrio sp. TaxID=2024836 RepID=UPI002F92DCB4
MKNIPTLGVRRLIALLPALFVVAACSANPATGKQSFTAFMSPEKELQVGAEEHPKMIKQFGGAFTDKAWNEYVRDIGLKLASYSEMPDLPWTFTVLNDTQVNAFALPGGYVYITRGLLALASDEAEMAGVLSHEIGHVTARHTAQRYSTTVATNLGIQVLGVLTQAAGVGGAENIAAVGAELALKSYSREQELESDMLGVRYLSRAGYDPQAMASFFEKLSAHQRIEGLIAGDPNAAEKHNILATHPRTADRISQAIDLADKNGAGGVRREVDRYLAKIDGMVFGDDVDQGLVRGTAFVHPALRFRFDVPEGFSIHNMPELVLAVDKNENSIKFADAPVKDVREAGSMDRYLTQKWSGDANMSHVEWLDINGMKAVTGGATVWTGKRNVEVRRIVVEQDKEHYWRFQFVAGTEDFQRLSEAFRRTTYSFRTISRSEAAAVHPWRLRVVTVGRGVTFNDLAESMAVDEYKKEWFEALNGIGTDDPLIPGMRVKVVK